MHFNLPDWDVDSSSKKLNKQLFGSKKERKASKVSLQDGSEEQSTHTFKKRRKNKLLVPESNSNEQRAKKRTKLQKSSMIKAGKHSSGAYHENTDTLEIKKIKKGKMHKKNHIFVKNSEAAPRQSFKDSSSLSKQNKIKLHKKKWSGSMNIDDTSKIENNKILKSDGSPNVRFQLKKRKRPASAPNESYGEDLSSSKKQKYSDGNENDEPQTESFNSQSHKKRKHSSSMDINVSTNKSFINQKHRAKTLDSSYFATKENKKKKQKQQVEEQTLPKKMKKRKHRSKNRKKSQLQNNGESPPLLKNTTGELIKVDETPVKPQLPFEQMKVQSPQFKSKLKQILQSSDSNTSSKKANQQVGTLRERMLKRLQASRFRYLNEQLYSIESKNAQKLFQKDPDAFQAYHTGYKQQITQWPLNPLDKIISSIKNKPKNLVVADFGCGDAKLSKSVPNTVHSFDLLALSDEVTACDMAHTPLADASVDIVVFCLSLMGTNLSSYLIEANRVLKEGGLLKIAEVESRFESVENFIQDLSKFGFTNMRKDLSHKLFYFLDFKKQSSIKKVNKLPSLNLKPCLYKKR